MYVPAAFAETNLPRLHAAIEDYSFAVLISGSGGELTASHLPLILDRAGGANGTLLGHMARANGQWQSAAGQEVLAVFSGPHSYISPQWYQAPHTVPTWNYVAVHAYGRLEVIDDDTEALSVLQRTIGVYEAALPRPWQLAEPAEYVERLLGQIVAFRIPIDTLEGKWKLNQNRPLEQRQRVIAELAGGPDDNAREIARLMVESIG